ncbi:MAG TPA: alpha-amylase family glycosyl hydrolase [Anaerolineales bacterium]|nr:alpha-amylase family glycosyl hydrolase [Anaerolineales bacterium]
MKIAHRSTHLLLVLFILTACVSSPAPATATATPEPSVTVAPSPTRTPTPEPTETRLPTATPVPLPTIPSTPVQPVTGLPQGTDDYPWWNDTVFYEVFVRSFYDSDGDGIGDFNGLTEKLHYLNDGDPDTTTDLGVTGLWLMPIHPSPSYHGYDVTDYYAVNPEYGTMEDFQRFLDEAHARGIRVIIDWVLNHTSSRHPWFEQAQDPESPYRDWYRWTSERPTTPGWHPGGGQEFYYALFWVGMPDLNYANPEVVAEMKNVARFWLQDIGVDGFRLDGAKHIFEEGTAVENTPLTHAWYKELRSFYKGVNPQAMTVGEVWNDSGTVSTYLQGDELDLAFDFDLAKNTVFSAGIQQADYMADVLVHDLSLFRPGQFATFLTNHDQDRTMSVLNDNVDAARNAAFLLLTSPGVPFLYYGEEIGMLGEKPDEDIRRPLQWSADDSAGFTTGSPWRAPEADYTTKNIEAQSEDPNSLLSLYRRLIQTRNQHAALRVGDYYFIETGHRAVYASLRASREELILTLINLSAEPVSDYALNLAEGPLSGEYILAPLLDPGQFDSPTVTDQGGFEDYKPLEELPPYGRFILQMQAQTP